MIKLILSDMDGTLVNHQGTIPADFPEVFAQMKEQNIMFSAASGRQYYNLLDLFNDYKDDMLFLAENGSFVMYKGQEIYSDPIAPQDVSRIIRHGYKLCVNGHIHFMANGKKAAYVSSDDPLFLDNVMLYCSKVEHVKNLDAIDDDIVKIAFFDSNATAAETFGQVEAFASDMQVLLSSAYWIDVMKRGANKGNALKHIMQLFKLQPTEVAAFGDYMNDYEMMQTVYYGFAMKNAYPALKKAARFETEKTNDEAGVTDTIKKILKGQLPV